MAEKSSKDITVKELTVLVMKQAEEKGFGTKPDDISLPEKVALLHSEITELYEAYRNKNMDGKDGFAEELGDVLQRVLHLAGMYQVDIEDEVLKKLESNKKRTWDWDKMNEKHT